MDRCSGFDDILLVRDARNQYNHEFTHVRTGVGYGARLGLRNEKNASGCFEAFTICSEKEPPRMAERQDGEKAFR